jgi:hypothetical protein
MFILHPLTRENTPFPTSSNILAKYTHDGISHARLIVAYGDSQGDTYDVELDFSRARDIRRSES